MTFQSRIQVHPNYIKALGTAFYNFTYLEWIVMWTIVKLSESGFEAVPRGQTASFIAKALAKAIENNFTTALRSIAHETCTFPPVLRESN